MYSTINAPAIDRDAELVEALRLHEAPAAECLFATFGDRAYRLAMRITGNQQDAGEAVQDAFWSVARKIATFPGDSAFGTWLYRIVSNAAYAKLRRRPRGRVVISLDAEPAFHEDGRDDALSADGSAGLDDPAVQTELRAVLSSTVSELPPHYRAAIVLHDVEGFSMAELCDALGITVGTAKTRAHRGHLWRADRVRVEYEGRPDAYLIFEVGSAWTKP
jgi:RNA polymerase sigma-70 factor (ECF subfamily)